MKAVIYKQYGSPDVLQLTEVDTPVPNENEVLIKIHAVSINDWDYGLLIGKPFANKMINGINKPKRQILGSDIAGTVEKTGKNIKMFKPGDRVYGDLSGDWGGFAEYVCAKESQLALIPEKMTYEEASSIPQASILAVQGLIDHGKIKDNMEILINGAGGGVGTFGIQIARQFNVRLTGVDSAGKLDMLKKLGYDNVIDYKSEDFTKINQKYDLILDAKTNRPILNYLKALKSKGKYVTVGGDTKRLMNIMYLNPLIYIFTKKKLELVILKMNKDLKYINNLFDNGKLKPVIDRIFTFKNIPEALTYYGEGKFKGKIVIKVI